MNKLLYFMLLLLVFSCTSNSGVERYQRSRGNVFNVSNDIKEIVIDNPLIGRVVRLNLIDDYLIVSDHTSYDTLIYLFNKNDFSYVVGTGYLGEGPNEITNMGNIVVDEVHHKIHVPDLGKMKILCYDLDSLLTNRSYLPEIKTNIGGAQFPDRYAYLDDTLCIARIITKIKGASFQQSLARWNMITGEMIPMKYAHPEVERKRAMFAVSTEKDLIVETYNHHDLMTICNMNGDLKYNIYGPYWDNRMSNSIHYYGKVVIYRDKIVVAYSGGDTMTAYEPTCFIVFDLDGNYIKTIETGHKIQDYCVDSQNNRIVMALVDEFQFAYLDLDGLL
ncbi:6-bladed beta-propeller [Bacteroides sp. NGMCC 1.200775]|uniref:6-bladed beta-propeller n=1 Tax=Bacteroides sp. NGMCC 1.200775 TaxID=3044577 RepID=UPI0034643839